ncbi:MAG TPA: hypothetical protein PLO23_00270 [Alphaproteobacteria bacterium]|nr:hypothetical protein [Alphaproteobacteria bacterium]
MALAGYSVKGLGADFLKQGAFVPLRRFDPGMYGSKIYRDSVMSSNILRKATQLVAQIEAAAAKPKTTPIETILASTRGKGFDFRA